MKHCPAKSRAARFLAQGRPITDTSITYMLRSCNKNMGSYGGFTWPRHGAVDCPDWSPRDNCGNGLHGLLMGQGDVGLTAGDSPDAAWLVCAVWAADVVDLGAKIKAPRAWVAFAGKRDTAVAHMQSLGANTCVWGTATAGDGGTATAGDGGTATAGHGGTATAGDGGTATACYRGTATAGHGGTATAGDYGTATAGHGGTATAGDYGTATACYRGTATAGDGGTATAGDGGTATAGDGGTATAGDYGTATACYRGTATAGDGGTATAGDGGTATAGDGGTATAGVRGTATAGDGGELRIRWHDDTRYRLAIGYVGENGIEANVAYVVRNGKLGRSRNGRD